MALASVEVVKSLCRPGGDYWCGECCAKRQNGNPCCNYGDIGEGMQGCLVQNITPGVGRITKPDICRDGYDCLSMKTQEDIDQIRKKITELPAGEFKMSQVLKSLGRKLH